jgi:hypothetical protein
MDKLLIILLKNLSEIDTTLLKGPVVDMNRERGRKLFRPEKGF